MMIINGVIPRWVAPFFSFISLHISPILSTFVAELRQQEDALTVRKGKIFSIPIERLSQEVTRHILLPYRVGCPSSREWEAINRHCKVFFLSPQHPNPYILRDALLQ